MRASDAVAFSSLSACATNDCSRRTSISFRDTARALTSWLVSVTGTRRERSPATIWEATSSTSRSGSSARWAMYPPAPMPTSTTNVPTSTMTSAISRIVRSTLSRGRATKTLPPAVPVFTIARTRQRLPSVSIMVNGCPPCSFTWATVQAGKVRSTELSSW
jgi:hypothetical protein